MDYEDLKDALDGLHAYDRGCVDSGIHDEKLRARCIEILKSERRPTQLFPDVLSEVVRDLYLTDKAIEMGYGIEDVAGFIHWLGERMEMPEVIL